MGLRYDFDILRTAPEATLAGTSADPAASADRADPFKALFRDPKTAQALRNASPKVRALFERSGFGFDCYDCGAPAGHYPAHDEDDRALVIANLAENLFESDLEGEDFQGFDFAEFLDLVDTAVPLVLDAPAPQALPLGSPGDPPGLAPVLDYDPWAEPKKGAKVGSLGLPGAPLPQPDSELGSQAMMRAEVRTEMRSGGIIGLLGSPGKALGATVAFLGLIYLIKA